MKTNNLFFAALLGVAMFLFTACTDTTTTGAPKKVMSQKAYNQVMTTYDYVADRFCEGLCKVKKDNKIGFIDKSGKLVIPCQFETGTVSEFSNGMARISTDTEKGTRYGFINRKGETQIQPTYYFAADFSEGLARVVDAETRQGGFINPKGEVVIPLHYDYCGDFHEGLAAAYIKSAEKYGYIDAKEKVVIEPVYRNAGDFSGGVAIVVGTNRAAFVINKKGEVQFVFGDDYVCKDDVFTDGLVPVLKVDGWKCGFLNAKGEEVIPCIYDDVDAFEDGKAEVEQDDDIFVIDTKGQKVAE